jgi:hypothetical protein
MSTSPRPKYSTTSPARFSPNLAANPRKEYDSPDARPPGRSGGGPPVSTPHRVSTSKRKGSKRSRRRD